MLNKIFIVFAMLFWSGMAFAYDDQTTHPALTDEIVDFHNLSFDKKLTAEEKEWIVSGAMSEDTPPRWINHFYDPINTVGWSGESTGVWPTMLVQYFSDKIISSADPVSSLNWIHNQKLQSEYGEYKGNRTWERAIYEYANGNAKEAYITLGYILHLVEDATVPDHTRNDTHAHELHYATGDYGSPYEEFNKRFTRSSFNIAAELKRQGLKPEVLASVDDYLISLAEYSNKYFFSKDTINDPKYTLPKIIRNDDNFGYGEDEYNKEFPLVNLEYNYILDNNEIKKVINYYLPTKNNQDSIVLLAYFTRLSREAIINGAGVVELFLREGEKAKQNLASLEKPPQETAGIDSWMDEIYGLANVWQVVKSGASSAVDYVVSVVTGQDIIPQTANLASPIGLEMLGGESVSVTNADVVETPANPIGVTYGEQLSAPTTPVIAAATLPTTPIYIVPPYVAATEAIPNWFPRQPGSLSRDSGGGGGGSAPQLTTNTTNNQPPTTPEGETSGEAATTTATTTPAIPTDTTPPDIVMSVTECAASISTASCLLLSGNINISWNSAAEDLAEYELTINNTVIPLATATTTVATTTLADNSTHTISLRAKDTAGNRSEAASQNIEVSSVPVVINEVAWAGTENGSSNDEWLELYNRTNQDIDLAGLPTGQAGWTLFSASQKPYINLVGVIPAKSYFLLERKDDTTISDITADQIYGAHGHTGDWALNNSGEVLTLTRFNGTATTTIDQTILCNNKWCGGSNNNYYTSMERVSPDTLGTDPTNWSSNLYSGIIRNGKSANGVALFGTPKQRNSVNYLIANGQNTISQNLTLKKANSPYLVNNQIQTVAAGVTLALEPGVVIKFYNSAGLEIDGALNAQGVATEPIVFTSLADDTYGGDTNGDATSTSPLPGDWYGLSFKEGSDASALAHTIVRYAGKYYTSTPTHERASVYIEGSSPTITDSVIEHGNYFGLSLINANAAISGNTIRNNVSEAGLRIAGGASRVENNTLTSNRQGMIAVTTHGNILNNTFTNNTAEAMQISGDLPTISENGGGGNTLNGIVLSGETAPNSVATLAANTLPYIPQNFTVAASSTLNIGGGTTFKPQGNFYVYGTVNLNGATPSDILFTSPADDAASGDTTNDGAQTPMPGSWIGLTVFPGGALAGGGATFRYGGYAGAGGQESASIMLKGGNANLRDTIFENNYPHGLTAETGASLTLTDSVFRNHNFVGVWGVKAALAVWGATVNISGVTFTNNALGISSDISSLWSAAAAVFNNNLATTTPANLF